jgi:hypothetical protein
MPKNGTSNAFKHGAYANSVVLSFENIEAFNNILEKTFDEFRLEGALEKETVGAMACLPTATMRMPGSTDACYASANWSMS